MTARESFAVLRGARRVWAIGAIHGEAAALTRMHAALAERLVPGDRLVYLGNYLGFGDGIVATIDELVAFRRRFLARFGAHVCDLAFVRGAQEEMWSKLLQLQHATGPAEVLDWMLERGLTATLAAYGFDAAAARRVARGGALMLARWTSEVRAAMYAHAGHGPLMSALRRAAFTADGALLFVHAGIDPARELTDQKDVLWWGHGDFDALSAPYFDCRRLVRGFARRHKGVRLGRYTATVDAGAGFGGPLAALCFAPDGAMVDRLEV